jgi:hypothetical protein
MSSMARHPISMKPYVIDYMGATGPLGSRSLCPDVRGMLDRAWLEGQDARSESPSEDEGRDPRAGAVNHALSVSVKLPLHISFVP